MRRPVFIRGSRGVHPGPVRIPGLAAILLLVLTPALAAQMPATGLGLGYPVPPLDARAAALGGTGLGLLGGSLSGRNPADLRGFRRPTLGLTYAPEAIGVETLDGTQTTGRSRVAIVQAAVPIRSWTVGLGFASGLDQDWGVRLQDTLRSSFGTYPYDERREHDGGVSAVTLAAARDIGRFSVGIDGSLLTGSLRQSFSRNFEPALEDPANTIELAGGQARFSWSGFRIRGGAATQLGSRVRLSGVVGWSTDLTATRDTAGSDPAKYDFDMPFEWAIGGSAQVANGLLATAAIGYSDWGAVDSDLESASAADVLWYGVGVEYVGVELFGAGLPLRAGVRRTDLPFFLVGTEQLVETAGTFGVGLEVGGGLASFDIAVELGTRGDLETSLVQESFRRLSISMALFQL
jgi:hypothetical protein